MTKPNVVRSLYAASILLALAGCTHAAKDFGGSWKTVNHFQDEPTEIPLERNYAYYASPMDGTLKSLLTRWSKDTGMVLSYQLTSDYTLYKPVSKIQTNDIRSAAAELTTIYATEGVLVTINDKQILVGAAAASHPVASESAPAAASSTPPATATSADPTTSGALHAHSDPVVSESGAPKTATSSTAPAAPGSAAASVKSAPSNTPAASVTPATQTGNGQ